MAGDPRWSLVYQGRTYLFSSPAHRQRFLADPDRYAPAYSGHDPVLVVDANRYVPGRADYCMAYGGRLYMFSSSVTLARFQDEPKRYARPSGKPSQRSHRWDKLNRMQPPASRTP